VLRLPESVRLESVRIGALEVGFLMRLLVGLVGLNRGASLVSFIPLSSVSFVSIFATALRVAAPFIGVVAKHVRVPC